MKRAWLRGLQIRYLYALGKQRDDLQLNLEFGQRMRQELQDRQRH